MLKGFADAVLTFLAAYTYPELWRPIGVVTACAVAWFLIAFALSVPNWIVRCVLIWTIIIGYPSALALGRKWHLERSATEQMYKDYA